MTWMTLAVTLMLTAGFAKLTSALLNRVLAVPQSRSKTSVIELFHFSSLPLYPVGLLFSLDHRAAVVGSFQWQHLSPLELLMVALGVLGFALLIRSTINFQRYRPPGCEQAVASQFVDFRRLQAASDGHAPEVSRGVSDAASFEQAEPGRRQASSLFVAEPDQGDWKDRLVGPRPMRRIALLPGNQQFCLEVSTKTYAMPRLPVEWDGLSIVHFADTHFRGAVQCAYFEAVCEQAQQLMPDLFVFTGDLLDDQELVKWLPRTLGRMEARLGKYFILGNHDWHLDTDEIRAAFVQHGWIELSSRYVELSHAGAGPSIVLAGDETPWMGSHPDLSQIHPETFRILLSHTPDNITWARESGIDLMLAGHTHGGQIRLPVLGPVYSPSRFGCRYASGVFWLHPTLMYVSRGISGREPIRYNCPPELTKLVLKCGRHQ